MTPEQFEEKQKRRKAAITPEAAAEINANLAKMQIGPRKLPDRFTCTGCPALKTESWQDHLDNDETDSGISAFCTAMKPLKNITAYWHETNPPPDWCPAKKG